MGVSAVQVEEYASYQGSTNEWDPDWQLLRHE